MSWLKKKGVHRAPRSKLSSLYIQVGNFVSNHIKETALKNMVVWQSPHEFHVWPCCVPMSNFETSFVRIARTAYVPLLT